MRRLAVSLVLAVSAMAPAVAFDSASQGVIDHMKPGKLVPISEVTKLMLGAERWCYREQDSACSWSEIYLSVDGERVVYEASNPWSEAVDVSFVDEAVLRDGRYICEAGFDWLPSVRAYSRQDGLALEGRDLAALKAEMEAHTTPAENDDCFDYLYQGANADTQVVTLLQRHYAHGEHQAENDVAVTLYFDKTDADALGWYW